MIHTLLSVLVIIAAGQLETDARKFIISNQCDAPVWAAYTGQGAQGITVNGKAGTGMWQQASGQKDELDVPETFAVGKFWAATGCNAQGTGCKVGGCPSGQCDGTQIGQSGATLAEFTLPGTETYDISITDGFNVPIAITPTGGTGEKCTKVTCGATTDLLTQCDPSLAFPSGSDTVWACFNPCTAGVQFQSNAIEPFNFKTAPSCCPSNDKTCDATRDMPFYAPLKAACNDGFVFPPETEENHECKGPEYLIEFCPGGKGVGANPSGNAPINQCAGGAIVGGGGTGTNSDGGGSFSGLAAGSGESCDGSTSSPTGTGTGTGTGTDTSDEESASDGTAVSAAGTFVGGAGGNLATASTAVGSSATAGTGAGAGTGTDDEVDSGNTAEISGGPAAPAPAASTSSTRAIATTANEAVTGAVETAAAPVVAPAASTSASCRGRGCRNGSGRGGWEARRLREARAKRDEQYA